MRKILKLVLSLICKLSSIAMLLSFLALYISPDITGFFGLLAILFPFLFLFNIILVLFFVFKDYKKSILPFISVLIGFVFVKDFYNYSNKNEITENIKSDFSIMSYNVKQFGLYDYYSDWSLNHTNKKKIIELIKEKKPDIICFQESYYDDDFVTIDTILSLFPEYYDHRSHVLKTQNKRFWGAVTLTKFPIIQKGKTVFESSSSYNSGFFTDLLINNDTIRLYNCHLQSVKLQQSKDGLIEDLIKENSKDNLTNKSKLIVEKLLKAFEKRAKQSNVLKDHIHNSPFPVIISGDFNDTPISYVYNKIKKGLNDAFIEAGKGWGNTYAGGLPFLRIDYILYDESFNCNYFDVIKLDASDHYPVYGKFKLLNNK